MKKSTLLSLLTTAAIITTTAGTYATWDSLKTSTQNSTFTFSDPVTITSSQEEFKLTEQRSLGNISASGSVSFTINDTKKLANALKIIPTIENGNGFDINDFEIDIKDDNGSGSSLTGSISGGFIDKTLNPSNTNTYSVTVTPKNNKAATKNVTVKLDVELLKLSD